MQEPLIHDRGVSRLHPDGSGIDKHTGGRDIQLLKGTRSADRATGEIPGKARGQPRGLRGVYVVEGYPRYPRLAKRERDCLCRAPCPNQGNGGAGRIIVQVVSKMFLLLYQNHNNRPA